MNKTIRRVALFLLLPIVAISLFSCGTKEPEVQKGIVISPEKPYSSLATLSAQSTFYDCLEYYTKKTTGVKTLSKGTQANLTQVAKNMAAITAENPIEEVLYLEAVMAFGDHGKGMIDELLAYSETGESDFTETRALYFKLTDIAGTDAVLDTWYRLIVYSYDYRYRVAVANYEQRGEMKYKDEYEMLARERAVLEQMGQAGFETVFLQSLTFADLFLADVLSSDKLLAFTDAEILLFLRSLDICATEIPAEGWELVLEKMLPKKGASSYEDLLGAELLKNGDYKNLAAVMNDVTALIYKAATSLTEREIALLRAGDRAAVIQAVMQKFTDDDFARLDRIASVALHTEAYEAIASETYADYDAYAAGIRPVDIKTLRDSLGQSIFYESLERYIAGISPAFSYGMRK